MAEDMVHSALTGSIPTESPVLVLLRRLAHAMLCGTGRHRLYRYARVGYGTFQVRCRRCERRWGMNDNICAFLPWNDVAELYEGPGALFPRETWTLAEATPHPRPTAGRSREGGGMRQGN